MHNYIMFLMLKPGLGVRESLADLALGHISDHFRPTEPKETNCWALSQPVGSTKLRLLKPGFKSLLLFECIFTHRDPI